jgi:hypothetical protein
VKIIAAFELAAYDTDHIERSILPSIHPRPPACRQNALGAFKCG